MSPCPYTLKRRCLPGLLTLALVGTPGQAQQPPTGRGPELPLPAGLDPIQPRAEPPPVDPAKLEQRVVEAGRMLAEQGYRVRRDTWQGELTPDTPVRVPVFLFEGNDYRFIIATDGPMREVLISVISVRDNPLPHRTEFGGPPSTRAISFSPEASGIHFIQLGISADGSRHESCLGFVYR